jgi:hypothetical protein
MSKVWKKGRGKLGFLDPLIGRWVAEAQSPIGPLRCSRVLEPVLGGSFIRLESVWRFGPGGPDPAVKLPKAAAKGPYQEICLIGPGDGGEVTFWSFTSDGKRSQGVVADATDVHPEAVGFEAQMPAGLARQVYWPDGDDGFAWAVESKTAKGWKRFTEHHYRRD